MELYHTTLSLQEKLEILSDAAKYDVSCTSSGVDRRGKKGSLGNSCDAGICHSFARAAPTTTADVPHLPRMRSVSW